MPDITLTVNLDKTVSIDNNYLAIQGEQITVDLTMDSSLASMGYDAYVDFLLPTGETCFKGAYDPSSGTISFTLGASDSILDKDGDVYWQLVLATTLGSVRTPYWKSLMGETKILPSINATSSAVLPYVPQMEYPDNYPAELIELVDVADVILANNVEDALQEIAGNINTVETNIGTLLYTENNYITDSEPLTTSVNKLDISLKDRADDISLKMNLAGGASNPFTAMPYVGTAPVVESGSNANGSYAKYADGTMICRHHQDTSGAVNVTAGAIFSSASTTWTYPVAFYAAPAFMCCEQSGIGSCWGGLGTDAASASSASFKAYSAVTSAGTATMSLIAIGRWKA